MTYRCASISTLLLACVEGVSFVPCSNQPKMLQQVFLMFSHFFPCQPCPQSIYTPAALLPLPPAPTQQLGSPRGREAALDFSRGASRSCCCGNELPALPCACKHTHAAVCATEWLQNAPDCGTEHRAEISAIN